MSDVITRFKMGQPIPEWLLAIEPNPKAPHSARGEFRFGVDVDVVDAPDCFMVMPKALGAFGPIIDASGTFGCNIFAASKPVYVANQTSCIMPIEADAWSGSPPGSEPVIPTLGGMQLSPPALYRKPPYLQRLWQALTGR